MWIAHLNIWPGWLLVSENRELASPLGRDRSKMHSSLSLPSHQIWWGKETSPSQEASTISAKRELRPQVEAGSHETAKCLQNKRQVEEAQSAETSQGCDRLGRCEWADGRALGSQGWEADLPGKSQVPSAHRLDPACPAREGRRAEIIVRCLYLKRDPTLPG